MASPHARVSNRSALTGQREQQHGEEHLEATCRLDHAEGAQHARDAHHAQHAHDRGVGAEGGGGERDGPVGERDAYYGEVERVPRLADVLVEGKGDDLDVRLADEDERAAVVEDRERLRLERRDAVAVGRHQRCVEEDHAEHPRVELAVLREPVAAAAPRALRALQPAGRPQLQHLAHHVGPLLLPLAHEVRALLDGSDLGEEAAEANPRHHVERLHGRGVAHGRGVDGGGVDARPEHIGPSLEGRDLEQEQRGGEDIVKVAPRRVEPLGAGSLARGAALQRRLGGARAKLAGEELCTPRESLGNR
eukprot:4213635-Prymnesium_polylepis.1